jgi:hypothetical protein
MSTMTFTGSLVPASPVTTSWNATGPADGALNVATAVLAPLSCTRFASVIGTSSVLGTRIGSPFSSRSGSPLVSVPGTSTCCVAGTWVHS